MDLSIFATPEAWISLLTLMFLEVVLGVDNIVFISITTNRLAPEHQHIGRKLGLFGAMISRCIFLCSASYLVHMTKPLFTLDLGFFQHAFNVRDLVLLAGGAYLIYKGIDELRDVLALTEEKAAHPRSTSSCTASAWARLSPPSWLWTWCSPLIRSSPRWAWRSI